MAAPLLSINSKIDLETFSDFYKLNFNNNKKAIIKNLFVMFLFLLTVNLVINFLFRATPQAILRNSFLFFIVVAIVFAISMYRQRPKSQFKKISAKSDLAYSYTFFNDFFNVSFNIAGSESQSGVQYNNIGRAYETGIGFYIYTNKGTEVPAQHYVISKNSLSEKQTTSLRAILRDRLNENFVQV